MKKILVIICFIYSIFPLVTSAQDHVLIEKTRTCHDNEGDRLHKLANEFAEAVGNKLKEMYPATVTDIEIFLNETSSGITLSYKAIVSRCKAEEALYYFDHRGAMTASNDLFQAEDDAKRRAFEQTNIAKQKFAEAFGNPYQVWYKNAKVKTKYADFRYLYLAENFIAAGLKKE